MSWRSACSTRGCGCSSTPGIVFRDGPSGRRAGLIAGPDVGEVVGGIRGASGDGELDEAAQALDLTRAQVDVAIRYYGEFGEEIDERIRRNSEEADRRLALLAGRRRAHVKLLLDEMDWPAPADQLVAATLGAMVTALDALLEQDPDTSGGAWVTWLVA